MHHLSIHNGYTVSEINLEHLILFLLVPKIQSINLSRARHYIFMFMESGKSLIQHNQDVWTCETASWMWTLQWSKAFGNNLYSLLLIYHVPLCASNWVFAPLSRSLSCDSTTNLPVRNTWARHNLFVFWEYDHPYNMSIGVVIILEDK